MGLGCNACSACKARMPPDRLHRPGRGQKYRTHAAQGAAFTVFDLQWLFWCVSGLTACFCCCCCCCTVCSAHPAVHIDVDNWTPSSRVCCAPGLPESANEVATGSLRYIVIISISWWRLPDTRRCLALATEDRKSEVRSQPLRTQRSQQSCESTPYILFRCSHMRCADCSALSCPAQMQQAAVD